MLKIINNLAPFFEDCYRKINVREYAKLTKITPPTASKRLEEYNKEGILLKEKYRNNNLFQANHESKHFRDLSRIYWSIQLKELVNHIRKKYIHPTIILFGSLAKAETTSDSDVDLAIITHKSRITTERFGKKLHRHIQLFRFSSIKNIKNKELANNILNGYILQGRIRL